MNDKIEMTIWGRKIELGITYDCYSDEDVLESQIKAVKAFEKAISAIDAALDDVKEYCILKNKEDITMGTIDNIFKYVAPKYLYVVREENKHIVALMCNYKFDMENGIAIVFENEKFVRIGKQDIIL